CLWPSVLLSLLVFTSLICARSLSTRPPPRPTLFPYTTLFRSRDHIRMIRRAHRLAVDQRIEHGQDLALQVGLDQVGADLQGKVLDRKSTRLNSSHVKNSYAVFCLKKKNIKPAWTTTSATGAIA